MINSAYMYKCASNDPGQPGTPGYTDMTRVRQGWGMANLRYLKDQGKLDLPEALRAPTQPRLTERTCESKTQRRGRSLVQRPRRPCRRSS